MLFKAVTISIFSFQCLKALLIPQTVPAVFLHHSNGPSVVSLLKLLYSTFFCWWNLLCINFGGDAGACVGWEGDKSNDKSGLTEPPDCLIRAPSLNHCSPGAVQPNLIGLRDCHSTLALQTSTVNSFCPSWRFFDTHLLFGFLKGSTNTTWEFNSKPVRFPFPKCQIFCMKAALFSPQNLWVF